MLYIQQKFITSRQQSIMNEQIILRSTIRAREVRAALDYVYSEWGEPSPLCVIDVTNNFAYEYQKCHFSPEKVYDNRKAANGIMAESLLFS